MFYMIYIIYETDIMKFLSNRESSEATSSVILTFLFAVFFFCERLWSSKGVEAALVWKPSRFGVKGKHTIIVL